MRRCVCVGVCALVCVRRERVETDIECREIARSRHVRMRRWRQVGTEVRRSRHA